MRLVAALLALLVLAASCSRRERANPLDGGNPTTGGAPQGFNAVADDATVRLRWTPQSDLPIDGFQLMRLAPGDSLYRPFGPLLPSSTSRYTDVGALNGLDYRYRIYFVIGGTLAARFAEDVATPGEVRPWVVDAAGGRLLRLSPDGRDVATAQSGFGSSSSLAVTPGLGPVWVADMLSGFVDIVDPITLHGPRLQGVQQPSTIALDPFDGSAWICDLTGSVKHYNASGFAGTPPGISLLNDPEGVATDPTDGALWVAEYRGGAIRRYQRDGVPLGSPRALLNPSRIAVDSTTGEAWVASLASGYVWQISPALEVRDSLRLRGPIGLALDWRRRVAWIADSVGDELVAVDMDTRDVLVRVPGLGAPRDVAVDLLRGEAWVASAFAGRVYRLSPAGVVLTSVGGLGEPAEVRLDPVLR